MDKPRPTLKLKLKIGNDTVTRSYENKQESDNATTSTDDNENNPPPLKITLKNNTTEAAPPSSQKIPTSIQTELQAKIQMAKYREALKLTPDKTRRDSMKQFFEWLLRQHQRKDPHQIFAEPVTDQIAPRYSQVIKNPISFHDIKQKINKHQYENVKQIRSDFILCFENCNTYNTPDTIFYQSGKRMLSFTKKITSNNTLMSLYNQLPFFQKMQKRTVYALLDISDKKPGEEEKPPTEEELRELLKPYEVEETSETTETESSDDKVSEKFNSDVELEDVMSDQEDGKDDDMKTDEAEEIKKKAIEAAKKAKERLARIRPNDKMSYIYREKDGSVRLNVLVGGKKGESVKTVGDLVGQINKGCGRPTLQIVEKITKNRKRTVFLNSLFSNNFYPHLLASTANQEELVKKEKPQ